MIEPDELEPGLRALLDVERAAPGLSDLRRDAIRAELDRALGAPPTPLAPAGSAAAAARSARAARVLLFVAGGVVGALLHAGIASRGAAPTSPPPTPPEEVRPAAIESLQVPSPSAGPAVPLAEPPSSAQPATSARLPPSAHAAPASSPPDAAVAPLVRPEQAPRSTSMLAAERAIVERGRNALGRRAALSALEAFRDHTREYPGGQLAEERDALQVEALALAGRSDDARRKAAEFSRRYPESVFAARVAEVLRQLQPGASAPP